MSGSASSLALKKLLLLLLQEAAGQQQAWQHWCQTQASWLGLKLILQAGRSRGLKPCTCPERHT